MRLHTTGRSIGGVLITYNVAGFERPYNSRHPVSDGDVIELEGVGKIKVIKVYEPERNIIVDNRLLQMISPNHLYDAFSDKIFRDSDRTTPLDHGDLDIAIEVFESRMAGWYVEPLRSLGNGADFVILSALIPYFEFIEMFRSGASTEGQSAKAFVRSVARMYPNLSQPHGEPEVQGADAVEKACYRVYYEVRCKMAHAGFIYSPVLVDFPAVPDGAIYFDEGNHIRISVTSLLNDVEADIAAFVQDVMVDSALQHNFMAMWDECWKMSDYNEYKAEVARTNAHLKKRSLGLIP